MSKIEWTQQTWNPTVGCRRVSSGCDNCYAISEARRKSTSIPHYEGLTHIQDGRVDWTGKFAVAPDHIFEKPLRTRRPTTFFVNSMSDIFGEGVADEVIERAFRIMNACPQHRFQLLTKRPNRAVGLVEKLTFTANIWMGVSIEDDRYCRRADLLRKIPAMVRFISAEPLLGPLPSLDLSEIDWIIVGGESGRSKRLVRRMQPEWARELRELAVASGTAFFFKQWGNWSADGVWCRSKATAGRLLDGRVWDEMPGAPSVPWQSIPEFRAHLRAQVRGESSRPVLHGQSPRVALRAPIHQALQIGGPAESKVLRERVFRDEGLDISSARLVNYFAWALVDLQAKGFVVATQDPAYGHKRKVYSAAHPFAGNA